MLYGVGMIDSERCDQMDAIDEYASNGRLRVYAPILVSVD